MARLKLSQWLKQASPMILCVTAAAGVVGTAILAVKATPKAQQLLDEVERDGAVLSTPERVLVMAPAYIPAAAVGAGTIFCIFGANVLNRRQQALLLSAYTLVDGAAKEYGAKVKEMLGVDAEKEIRNEIVKDDISDCPFEEDHDFTKPLFYDEYGKRYFNATMLDVRDAEYHLNRNFALRGYSSLNEFYAFLGLDSIDVGEAYGWDAEIALEDGFTWIDFEHDLVKLEDGLECYVIRYPYEPHLNRKMFAGIRKSIESR